MENINIFIAYSRDDKEILNRLKISLSVLKRVKLVDDIWCDEEIEAGQEWESAIIKQLENSDIVLLLVSPSFIASEYCFNKELNKALARHHEGKCVLIPIIARTCSWQLIPELRNLQALPTDGVPIKSIKWKEENDHPYYLIEKDLTEIARKIKSKRVAEKNYVHFNKHWNEANEFIEGEAWEKALDSLNEALKFHDSSFEHTTKDINEKIQFCRTEIDFLRKVEFAEQDMEMASYESALEYYEQALQLKENKEVEKKKSECQQIIALEDIRKDQEDLKAYIDEANELFLELKFQKAHEGYLQALNLYREELDIDMSMVNRRITFYKLLETSKFNFNVLDYDEIGNYVGGMAVVQKDDLYGYLDSNLKEITPIKYTVARNFNGNLALVEKDGKYGFIDKTGKEVIKLKFDFANGFNENIALVGVNGKYGYIDNTGKYIAQPIYDEAKNFNNGLALVKKSDTYSFIDNSGKVMLELNYDEVKGFANKNKYCVVKKDGFYGYIDRNGKELVPPIYEEAKSIINDLAVVKKNGKYGFINMLGEVVIPFDYDSANSMTKEGTAKVIRKGQKFLINRNNERVT